MKDYVYNKYDLEATKIIDDFLPDKMFDAHMHLTHNPDMFNGCMSFDDYYRDMKIYTGDRLLKCNGIINPEKPLMQKDIMNKSLEFFISELKKLLKVVVVVEP